MLIGLKLTKWLGFVEGSSALLDTIVFQSIAEVRVFLGLGVKLRLQV